MELGSRANTEIGRAGKYYRLNFTSQTKKCQNLDVEITCEPFPGFTKKT